jgi:DeoR/GlpR family transcriptional regulator of sugar metabolism/DNA-binding LacI/PurR family transcriptional regulator
VKLLEQEGLAVRKHGSVLLLQPSVDLNRDLNGDDFQPRVRIMGKHALLHINPGDLIYLSGGEITWYIAASLPQQSNIPIVTDDLEVVRITNQRKYTSPVYVLPGRAGQETGRITVEHAQSFLTELAIDKAFFSVSSYADGIYYMETAEAAANAAVISKYAKKLYLILDSQMLDKRGEFSFPYTKYRDKVQEILIDDNISQPVISYLFPRRDPVVMYGSEHAYKSGKRKKYRIGFLVIGNRIRFFQPFYSNMLECVEAHDNLTLVIRETDGGFFSTVKNTDILLNERVDMIINYSLSIETVDYIGEKCRLRGVKLINVDLPGSDSVYFGANNSAVGMLAGNHTIEYIRKHWRSQLDRIIALAVYGMDSIANLRIMTMVKRIQEEIYCSSPEPEIIEWNHPNEKSVEKLIQILLHTSPNKKLLFVAFNLPCLLAFYDIIMQYRNMNNTIMVSQNFTLQIYEMMKKPNSSIIGCVHFNPESYGEHIIDIALRMLNDQPVEKINYTNLSWISKETALSRTDDITVS